MSMMILWTLLKISRIQQTIYEHDDIVDAIKNKDRAGAENAMTRHLVNALHDITAHLNKGKA